MVSREGGRGGGCLKKGEGGGGWRHCFSLIKYVFCMQKCYLLSKSLFRMFIFILTHSNT